MAWHREEQRAAFCAAWGISGDDPRVVFCQDADRQGCAATKNRGVLSAVLRGAEIVIVLDDDCFPSGGQSLQSFTEEHSRKLSLPAEVKMFEQVTEPSSRGTPYRCRTVALPVAACMGFWIGIGDYDAPSQLVRGADAAMQFRVEPIFGRYFPLCGMNLAFRPSQWLPWCQFIQVPRFDDIWMGWLWQKEAYRRGYCFRLDGPVVFHARQSDVWANLREEAQHLERNETLWRDIAQSQAAGYADLCKLINI